MKKFKFTLESIYEYKQTVEKTQKADLSNAEAALRALREKERELDESFERNTLLREEALQQRFGVLDELDKFDAFFRHIREEKEALAVKIFDAEDYRARCQEKLMATMRELKTYTKLREEQYKQYLKDVEAEEEKEISDRVSFSAVSEE